MVGAVGVGVVVLGVDLALISALVVMSDVRYDKVPLVMAMQRFDQHSPVAHERRCADRQRVNRS